MEIQIPQGNNQVLFNVTLEPTVATLQKLAKEEDAGESEIRTVRGGKVRVAVGVPYFESFASRFGKKEISHDIKRLMSDFDFHFVSLSCSFQPDPNCRLIWARLGVKLLAESKTGEALDDKPIVYDMFPEEILSKICYLRKVNFAFGLKFNLGMVKSDFGLTDEKSRKELIVYEPEIFASGIRRSNPAWDFRSTEEKGIWGNKSNLLLIIQAPKDSCIKGRFLLGAEVAYNIGKWVKIPLAKKEDEAVNIEYSLSD